MYQAGTLSGNPLATAAGLAVLEALDAAAYAALSARVARFGPALEEVLTAGAGKAGTDDRHGRQLEAQVPVVGPAVRAVLRAGGHRTGHRLRRCRGLGRHRPLRAPVPPPCSTRGVALAPGPYEVAFPSMAHGDAELDRTLDVAAEAVMAALGG